MSIYIASLRIREGSFAQGFPVNLQIAPEGLPPELEFNAELPPIPELPKHYQAWQTSYLGLGLTNRLEAKKAFVSNYSYVDECDRSAAILLTTFNNWLDASTFRVLKEKFLAKLNPLDEIRILIQTEDAQLQCLPWHLAKWFEPFTKAEIAISSANFETNTATSICSRSQVRVLAIIGNSEGLDTERDRQLLAQLPNCEITLLVEPSRQEVTEQLWHQDGWDILFFAGHSNSDQNKQTGCVYLNQNETLSTNELQYALQKAIAKNLKIAIFNSCDGLGLARELADLKIPQILVMREPVPDKVAQEFLKYFLQAYASGESFYLAVKEARSKLQGIEDRYPCASWLPLIVQNPGEIPPTWQQLLNRQELLERQDRPRPKVVRPKPKIWVALLLSLLSSSTVIGLRSAGILQGIELQAFDYLSQKLPPEQSDRRILLVGADEKDIGSDKYGFPIPDSVLAELINKLQQHKPAVIGVDIFRDRAFSGNSSLDNPQITNYWNQPNLVAVCLGDNLDNSIAPPPTSPAQQVGYVNIYDDSQVAHSWDDNVRRYLLSRSPNPLTQASNCKTNYSFAWQLAYRYFQSKDIDVTTTKQNWQFGDQIINRIGKGSGGYQKLDDRGNQLLISFRRTDQLAQQVTVRDILEERETFDPDWVKDRIVLIGITAKSVPDIHDTALGEIRGLHLHGHVISQLVSSVEGDRPLIWWLPFWGDWLWIISWSLLGGFSFWIANNNRNRSIVIGSNLIIISGICWLVLTSGGWLAWIPGIVAIAFSATGQQIHQVIRAKN